MNDMQIREIGSSWRFEVISDSGRAERVLAALDDCPCGDPECGKVRCQGCGRTMDIDHPDLINGGEGWWCRACVYGREE